MNIYICIICSIIAFFSLGCRQSVNQNGHLDTLVPLTVESGIESIKWRDGHSGVINDRYEFLLANIASPNLKSPKCADEKRLARSALGFVRKLSVQDIAIKSVVHVDEHGRYHLYLRHNNVDIGLMGVRRGFLAEWNAHGDRGALPSWCGVSRADLGRNPDYEFLCFSAFYSLYRYDVVESLSDPYCEIYKPAYDRKCRSNLPLDYYRKIECGGHIPYYDTARVSDIIARYVK